MISTSPRIQIQASSSIPSPYSQSPTATTTSIPANPGVKLKPTPSSAHLFVLGFAYISLNSISLSTIFLTSQNMLYCYNYTLESQDFLILYTFFILLLLHSTLCLSSFLILFRNLWPLSRRATSHGLETQTRCSSCAACGLLLGRRGELSVMVY